MKEETTTVAHKLAIHHRQALAEYQRVPIAEENEIGCNKVNSAAVITQTLEAPNNQQIFLYTVQNNWHLLRPEHLFFFFSSAKKEK